MHGSFQLLCVLLRSFVYNSTHSTAYDWLWMETECLQLPLIGDPGYVSNTSFTLGEFRRSWKVQKDSRINLNVNVGFVGRDTRYGSCVFARIVPSELLNACRGGKTTVFPSEMPLTQSCRNQKMSDTSSSNVYSSSTCTCTILTPLFMWVIYECTSPH